ncbi:MAG: glycosyltransferase family 39 protein [Deltaproteobacteria bacterium]|nr:glycosyltransferase family 39 protein [Deltaproteobacteria bacterium]MBI3386118.1 glycosyltransferase family 39 protein [Deltaproteobacteria bacterium]
MRWRLLLWYAVIGLGLATASVGNHYFAESRELATGGWWWLGGVGWLAVAALLGDRDPDAQPAPPWRRVDWFALLSIAIVALAFRLWRITQYPPPDAFGFEEIQTGYLGYGFYRDWRWPLEFPLTNLLPALSFYLFGLTSEALRAPFVLGGVLAPVFLFLALRRLIALPAAWTAAVLLAGCRWAAAAARFADEIFFPLSIMALTLWLFVRVVQQRRRVDVFLLSVVSADLFYAYTGYRVFPLLLAASSALLALSAWRHARLSGAAVRHFVLGAAVWAVLLSPGVVATVYHGSEIFSEAIRRHGDGWKEAVAEQRPLVDLIRPMMKRARDGWAAFVTTGDEIAWVNIPRHAMLDPVTAALATLALLNGMRRWRDPLRRLTFVAFALPFAALAVIPTNLNVSRCFVLLVPLFTLIGLLVDDWVRWPRVPQWIGTTVAGATVAAALCFNVAEMQRLLDSPVVKDAFVVPENTVLDAIHRVPAGVRVVLLTTDVSNAFGPSDYVWLTAHATGGRATSLAAALDVRDGYEHAPRYWITQGTHESEQLPALVATVCPHYTTAIHRDPNLRNPDSMATVGVVSVESTSDCGAAPAVGLRADYNGEQANGEAVTLCTIDPALMMHTIPTAFTGGLLNGRLASMRVRWSGRIVPPIAGTYGVRLEVREAATQLQIAGQQMEIETEGWEGKGIELQMEQATPVVITLRAVAGAHPAVRLYWTPPDGVQSLIPPTALQPDGE